MKFSAAAILLSSSLFAESSLAFQVALPTQKTTHQQPFQSVVLFETAFDTNPDDPVIDVASSAVASTEAKQDLLEVARSLKEDYGALIIDSSAQEKLRDAVEMLESSSEPPTDSSEMIGDWTLLCSTASAEKVKGIDTSKLPFFNADPVKEIREILNKSLKVQQLIKAAESDGIDRVDHVIQYMPPNELSEFVSNLPDFLQKLDINPLKVTEEKVVLVHKAEVESTIPVIKTKLSLQSVVVNVAGKSQNLDPAGADILGVNVPFGEFLNAGAFDTTYMDEDLRISRSKVGIVDQLRVFVRSTSTEEAVDTKEAEAETEAEYVVVEEEDDEIEAPSDVEGEEVTFTEEASASEAAEDEGDDNIEAPSDVESDD